jgi:hypothetical protein
MRGDAVKVIDDVGASGAAFLPARAEHEVIDDQLAAAVEKIGKSFSSGGGFKYVGLFHFFPGKFAALAAEFIAQAGEIFLFDQKFLPSGEPFGWRYDFWRYFLLFHGCLHDVLLKNKFFELYDDG